MASGYHPRPIDVIVDIDNGYDALLRRKPQTMSDQPGHDRQISKAFAVNADWAISNAVNVSSIITSNRTDAEYGHDEVGLIGFATAIRL